MFELPSLKMSTRRILLATQLVLLSVTFFRETSQSHLPCENDIYCYGDILHTVQRAKIFKDSKTFVDMRMKYAPHIVKSNFRFLQNITGPNLFQDLIREFVNHNFDHPGSEFEPWTPTDWTPAPKFLEAINDTSLRQFGSELNAFWKELGRKTKKDVRTRGDMYSMIPVNNPVIVPGGRFNEFYYWDQYWILKGLLHCEMHNTVRGMLENFFSMVEHLGYIPNGGRIYYQRSQPPLLPSMVKDYVDETQDYAFLARYISTLDKEFDFWMTKRLHTVYVPEKGIPTPYHVVRYNVELINPRPESYNADYDLVSHFISQKAQNELLKHIKTAAESGLDFSSRWFVLDEHSKGTGKLSDTKARFVIPVDLNVLIYNNARNLNEWHTMLGNTDKAEYYRKRFEQWEITINKVFWNETEGSWFDYVDYANRKGHKVAFYPTNIFPLFLNIPSMTSKTDRVLSYLEKSGALQFPGGIPSSMEASGEQWDFPNGWPPHVHWFIESLRRSGQPVAMKIAEETAIKWMTNNYRTYLYNNKSMFEKYDVTQIGNSGGGGEYEVVVGFGWTNGVIIDLLHRYGSILQSQGH